MFFSRNSFPFYKLNDIFSSNSKFCPFESSYSFFHSLSLSPFFLDAPPLLAFLIHWSLPLSCFSYYYYYNLCLVQLHFIGIRNVLNSSGTLFKLLKIRILHITKINNIKFRKKTNKNKPSA